MRGLFYAQKEGDVNPLFQSLTGFSKSPAVLAFTDWDANVFFRCFVGCLLGISIFHCFSIKILISAPFGEATSRGLGVSKAGKGCDCVAECCGTREKNRKGCGAFHARKLIQRYLIDFSVKGACLLGS